MTVSTLVRKGGVITTALLFALMLLGATSPVAFAASFFTPSSLPGAQTGVYYSQEIQSNHYGIPYTFRIVSGAMPPGIGAAASSDGFTYTVRGTPISVGSYTFVVGATRRDGGIGDTPPDKSYTLVVTGYPVITTASLPGAMVGQSYAQTIGVTGGVPGYEWSITAGSLPGGLVLNAGSGVISGTPTTNATYSFTVRAKDATGRTGSQDLSIAVDAAAPVIASASNLPAARVGSSYGADLVGAGGVGPYHWAMDSGSSLPAGLMLTTVGSDGQLRGTPTAAGSYSFSIKMTDARDVAAYRTFTLTVSPALSGIDLTSPPSLPPSITTSVLAGGTVGSGYSASLSATGGATPYSWNLASGSLPPGLSLSANGIITGTPTTAGTYTAYIEVFDNVGRFSGRNLSITIGTLAGGSTGGSTMPSSDLLARLNNVSRIGVSVHTLVKLPDDGNRFTQADSAVYYIGADGRRHAFPHQRVYSTWYSDFSGVRIISASDMASLPLGSNVTYHPGVKMVKFSTDPKVYAVSTNRALRWVKTEAAAQGLYGSSWNRMVDDVSDGYYADYTFGAEINNSADFSPSAVRSMVSYVSDVLPL